MSSVTTKLGLTKPVNIEQFNLATYNNNLDLIDNGIIAADKQGKGYTAYAEMASDSGALTTIAVATFIPSFTFKANRRYRIGSSGGGIFSDTTSTFSAAIQSCNIADASGAVTGLTQIKGKYLRSDAAGEGREVMDIAKENFFFTADTTLQIKLTIGRINGAGTLTLASSATNRVCLFIEDLGAQF